MTFNRLLLQSIILDLKHCRKYSHIWPLVYWFKTYIELRTFLEFESKWQHIQNTNLYNFYTYINLFIYPVLNYSVFAFKTSVQYPKISNFNFSGRIKYFSWLVQHNLTQYLTDKGFCQMFCSSLCNWIYFLKILLKSILTAGLFKW